MKETDVKEKNEECKKDGDDNGAAERFTYTYSAPTEQERREINDIRERYTERQPSKLDELKALDRKVKYTPKIIGAIVGIVGTLIFGLGMSMVLEWDIMLWGIIVMIIGGALAAISYFLSRALFNRAKRKYKDRILNLSDEILGESDKR